MERIAGKASKSEDFKFGRKFRLTVETTKRPSQRGKALFEPGPLVLLMLTCFAEKLFFRLGRPHIEGSPIKVLSQRSHKRVKLPLALPNR